MKTVSAILLLVAGIGFVMPSMAEETKPASPAKTAKPEKKAPAKKAAATPKDAHSSHDDDKEPDVTGLSGTPYDCELGNKLTIYQLADKDQIALQWNKRLHHMDRVTTTTGANRFENTKKGLIWIGIPAKGMLLDSKKGQQLANECKSLEQMAPKSADKS
ncbi:hypothetical protein [Noviherbaspirillum saxi]|uniref:Membrane-bound lysozyme-inhibitor of c-type lysozyme n=1 Tax=Noviherbaspirillum saxi TaxID=2320863 RepID=A0A3A3FVZ3_9BURK|nr:hypothetical protein [Noviherbaspirillum saxi]RJF98758.1 hypothetical protein D3871_09700 [Noviherbaspirillum saxi]